MSKIKHLTEKFNQLRSTSNKTRKHLLPFIDKDLNEITKKWLEKHDPKIIYKKSPKFKQHQKLKLAQLKASRQKKAQNRALERLRIYRAKHGLKPCPEEKVIWGDKWED